MKSKVKVARVISAGVSATRRAEVSEAVAGGGIVAISGAKLGSKDQGGGASRRGNRRGFFAAER